MGKGSFRWGRAKRAIPWWQTRPARTPLLVAHASSTVTVRTPGTIVAVTWGRDPCWRAHTPRMRGVTMHAAMAATRRSLTPSRAAHSPRMAATATRETSAADNTMHKGRGLWQTRPGCTPLALAHTSSTVLVRTLGTTTTVTRGRYSVRFHSISLDSY